MNTLNGHTAPINAVASSPYEDVIVSGGDDTKVITNNDNIVSILFLFLYLFPLLFSLISPPSLTRSSLAMAIAIGIAGSIVQLIVDLQTQPPRFD